MGPVAVPNGLFAGATQARGRGTFSAMNADLMITIAFCLIVLFGSLAEGVLFALSARNDRAKEEAERRAVEGPTKKELIAFKERSSAA
jgi:hypothetical protein